MNGDAVTDTEREEWKRLLATGMPIKRIAEHAGRSRHTVRKSVGEPPRKIERSRQSIWVVPEWYRKVREFAKSLGLVNEHGEEVGEGSAGRLIDEIGAGRIVCQRVD